MSNLLTAARKLLRGYAFAQARPDPSLFDCGYIRHVWSRADSYLEIETYF